MWKSLSNTQLFVADNPPIITPDPPELGKHSNCIALIAPLKSIVHPLSDSESVVEKMYWRSPPSKSWNNQKFIELSPFVSNKKSRSVPVKLPVNTPSPLASASVPLFIIPATWNVGVPIVETWFPFPCCPRFVKSGLTKEVPSIW